MNQPLAEILRPKTLDAYIGQEHLMGPGGVLRQALENDTIYSMILWGPPGVGKTTLALLIAEVTGADFYMLSAISSGVKDIREILDKAEKSEKKSILFIDEIHRFSKSQQDSLLGAVERGVVTLIGATTENPSFEVISPLLSRCQVYTLKSLEKSHLEKIIQSAKSYLEEHLSCRIDFQEVEALMRYSGGDARKLINAIELVTMATAPTDGLLVITNDLVIRVIQKNLAIYDKKGEQHYDIISAFIKSLRGSDPNAAVYWMARMLVAGEDPLFIARRMIILASEDIGNANPNALLLANNCFQAVHHIGMPEARIVLSQTAVYLACSPKSNASYMAIDEAIAWVKKTGDLPVPLHLRNAPTKLMKELGYHDGYKYAHEYAGNFADLEFLPESISGKKFYEPGNNARENELRRYLKNCWKDKYKYIILLLISLFSLRFCFAQDMHYSQFYQAPLELSPAQTGCYDGLFRFGANQKTQWLSVTKPYVHFSVYGDVPFFRDQAHRQQFSVGVNVNCDYTGDSRYNSVQPYVSLSYLKAIGRRSRHKLGLGMYFGFIQRSINYSAMTFDEQYVSNIFSSENPVSESFGKEKVFFFDCGIGALWNFSPNKTDRYTVGVNVKHLTQPNQAFNDRATRLPLNINAYFLSTIRIVDDVALQPAVYAEVQKQFYEVVFGTNVEYFQMKNSYTTVFSIGGGAFYRWNDALILDFFFEWQRLRLGVSYDITLSSLVPANKARGGLELSLNYIFKRKRVTKLGKEPCPFDIM